MDPDQLEVIFGAIFAVLIWAFVQARNRNKRSQLQQATPPAALLNQYRTKIEEMRAQNEGYHSQLNYLLQQGLDRRVAETLLAQVEKDSTSGN